MKGFLINNWITLLIVLVFAVYIVILALQKRWNKIRETAYKIMLKAEITITGTKRGEEKFDYVLQKVYSLMPFWLQFIYSPGDLKQKLQEWFNVAKDGLDDGKINNSVLK